MFVYFLPAGETMNRWQYDWIIRHKFEGWMNRVWSGGAAASPLIQDHEKCLWKEEARAPMPAVGIKLFEKSPNFSQDISPIENRGRTTCQAV